jgi:acetone carboxylase gamma subunit
MTAGYGQFKISGQVYGAHRVAWMLHIGLPIPGDLCVCHSCDNKKCCNPRHIWVGTKNDNAQDMVRKGRAHQPKGEIHPGAKLTESQVRQIRQETCPQILTARKYNISQANVSSIKTGKRWTHV